MGVAATVSGPTPTLLAGDTITLRPALVDEDGAVIPTEPSDWSAEFDAGIVTVSNNLLVSALTSTPTGAPTTLVLRHIETGLAVNVDVVVLANGDPDEWPDTNPGDWPDNEPAGMTPILSVDGSSKAWPGYRQNVAWSDAGRVAVVNDPASKYGKAIEKRFFIGDQSGWNGTTYAGHGGGFRRLYFRIVFKFSPNWQYHSGMNKFFYWGSTGRRPGQAPTQFFLGTQGGKIEFIDQSASGEPDSKGLFLANAPPITLNRYHTIEILHVSNTPGNSDGSLRMWIDGVEVQSFKHFGRKDRSSVRLQNLRWLDYADTRLGGLEALLFWGGQRDTKRVNDWIRLSEFYISGAN